MGQLQWSLLKLITLLALVGLACELPTLGREPEAPMPTPLGDTISFTVPFYSVSLDPGATVPGTQLHYVGPRDDGYEVTIDHLPTIKRSGDSFGWTGIIAPGVFARYHLRLTTTLLGRLVAAGPVELHILYPNPVELSTLDTANAPFHFQNIAVQFLIPEGGVVPGTTLIYQGPVDDGAWLSGITGYPYRAQGDSLVWTGRLRDNVTIRYTLRVGRIERNGLRLVGTADLWVAPHTLAASP